jgi:hypothetical protein
MNNHRSYSFLIPDKSDPVRGTAIIFLWAVVIVALLLGDPNQQARSQSTSQPAAEATCK